MVQRKMVGAKTANVKKVVRSYGSEATLGASKPKRNTKSAAMLPKKK